MDQFINFRVEYWTDGKSRMCALKAELPKKPELCREGYGGYQHYDGLSSIWFVFHATELKQFATSNYSEFQDGVHRLDSTGDLCVFYDALAYNDNLTRNKFGVAQVAYYAATIPMFVRKLIEQYGLRIWKRQEEEIRNTPEDERWKVLGQKHEISFSAETCARMTRLYGQGKGRVELDFASHNESKCRNALEQELSNSQFKDKLDAVRRIALNSTRGFHQTAQVRISIDSEDRQTGRVYGYYWVARNPQGNSIMNGAILDHSKNLGKTDWSVHT